MEGEGGGAPGARAAPARRRYNGIAAMAGAAALGRPRPHQPSRMVERRQRAVMGGASAIVLAQCRAGLPLRGCVLSGLPRLGWPWLERAHPHAIVDRCER